MKKKDDLLILIPARSGSSRVKNKMMLKIISQSNKHDIQEHLDKLENLFFDKKFHVVENWVWGGTVVNVIDAFFFHESIFSNKQN